MSTASRGECKCPCWKPCPKSNRFWPHWETVDIVRMAKVELRFKFQKYLFSCRGKIFVGVCVRHRLATWKVPLDRRDAGGRIPVGQQKTKPIWPWQSSMRNFKLAIRQIVGRKLLNLKHWLHLVSSAGGSYIVSLNMSQISTFFQNWHASFLSSQKRF